MSALAFVGEYRNNEHTSIGYVFSLRQDSRRPPWRVDEPFGNDLFDM